MCLLEFFVNILDNEQLLTTHSFFTFLGVKAQHLSLLSAHSQERVTFVSHNIINRILNIKSLNLVIYLSFVRCKNITIKSNFTKTLQHNFSATIGLFYKLIFDGAMSNIVVHV